MLAAEALGSRRLTPERPFPGPYPYREGDGSEEYFCGRREETRELSTLIRRNMLTVLFGASGLGKSSLLSAGLFPRLRADGYLPITVRLKYDVASDASHGPNLSHQIMADVRDSSRLAGVEIEQGEDCSTLWMYFHRLELWGERTSLLTPVLILDQFEEAFTLGEQSGATHQSVMNLFLSLADLVENRIPAVLDKSRSEDASFLAFTGRPPLVRIVISLREEYLPHLEPLRREISLVGRSRMRLLPFSGEQATAALLESAPHLLSADVAQDIVRTIASGRGTRSRRATQVSSTAPERPLAELVVEPALLNLFCYQLNERRLQSHTHLAANARPDGMGIGMGLVAASRADILSDFYADCLRGLRQNVREFVERRLISTSGYRLPVPLDDALAAPGVDERILLLLEERRLIRQETRQDAIYVQLVHDVLVAPILDSRARRRARRRVRLLGGALASASAAAVGVTSFVAYQVQTQGDEFYRELSPKVSQARNDYADAVEKFTTQQDALARSEREAAEARRALELAQQETRVAVREKQNAELSMVEARAMAQQTVQRVKAAEARLQNVERESQRLESKRLELARTVERLQTAVGVPNRPE